MEIKKLKPPTSQAPNRPISPHIRKPAPVAKKLSSASVDILDLIIGDQTVLLHDKFKTEQEKSEERQNLELEKRRKSVHAFHLPPMERKPRDTSRPRPSMDLDFPSSSSRHVAKVENALNLPPPPPPSGPPPPNAKRVPTGPPPAKKSKTVVDALLPSPPPSMQPPPNAKRLPTSPPPASLLQKANAILQDIGNSQVEIHQEEFVGDYQAIEEEKAPIEFHGEPVPDGFPKKKKEPKPIEEEPLPVDEFVELDYYNADLNIKASAQNKWLIDPDNGDGFALIIGGVRSNYGIIAPPAEEKFKRIAFQIQITELLSLKHVPYEETDPHDVRIGWSVPSASNVLGESSKSYAFCSIGRKLNDGVFQKYHDIFQKDDIITTVLDFEKQEISYYKNDVFLGVAFSNDLFSSGDLVFPHISIKNCKVLVNFGLECPDPNNTDKWKLPSDEPEDTVFVAKLDKSCLKVTIRPPKDKSECTVIMMVGIPGVGKTTWVKNYLREHPEEKWIHINSESFLAAMKVNGVQRKRVSTRWDMILGLAAKTFCRTLTLACRRRHNYIIDQTNCNRESRKRRLTLFEGFHRKCVVICPSEQIAEERRLRRSDSAGEIPVEALLELKATMSLPNNELELFEDVEYVEPPVERISEAIELVERYNQEGQPWIRKHKKLRPNNSVISDHRGHSNNCIGNM